MKIDRRVSRWLKKQDLNKPNFYLVSLGDSNYGLKAPLALQVRDIEGRGIWIYSDLLDFEAVQPTGWQALDLFCHAVIGAYKTLTRVEVDRVEDKYKLLRVWLPHLVDKLHDVVIARR